MLLCNIASRKLRPQAEEARSRIIALLQSHAGIRYNELARMTNLAHGTLSHHIKILQRQGRIRVRRDSGSTRLFPKNYDDELCNAIASASHPTTLAIMALLMGHEYANYTKIKSAMARSASTICEHLRRLYSAGIISRKRIDRVWVYEIKDVNKATMILSMEVTINKITLKNDHFTNISY